MQEADVDWILVEFSSTVIFDIPWLGRITLVTLSTQTHSIVLWTAALIHR